MGKTTGFLEYPRQEGPVVPPLERLGNFREFHRPLSPAAEVFVREVREKYDGGEQ